MLIILVIILIMFKFTSSGIVGVTDGDLHIELEGYKYGILIDIIIANEYR